MTRQLHAARNTISGVVSTGATWEEDISIEEDGGPAQGYGDDEWRFVFRDDPKSSQAILTLTTTDGTIELVENEDSTVLQIRVPTGRLTGVCGDKVADLSSKNAGTGKITHWGHGVVSFKFSPLAW